MILSLIQKLPYDKTRQILVNMDNVTYVGSGDGTAIRFVDGFTIEVLETPKQIEDLINDQTKSNSSTE